MHLKVLKHLNPRQSLRAAVFTVNLVNDAKTIQNRCSLLPGDCWMVHIEATMQIPTRRETS